MSFNLNPENINYVKFTYVDANQFEHITKAGIKRIDTRDILVSAKFENGFPTVNTPQMVKVSFVEDNGIYKTLTELKYIIQEEPFVYFALKMPEEVDYQQNREYFRVKIFNDVIIRVNTEENKQKILCKMHDISANGVCVSLDNKYDIPEKVQLSLIFDNREIITEAKFIRMDFEEKVIKASFNFVDLKQNDLDYISQICIKKQLENRRNNRL